MLRAAVLYLLVSQHRSAAAPPDSPLPVPAHTLGPHTPPLRAPPPPTPPRRTAYQRSLLGAIAAEAKNASENARPELLRALSAADFRAQLRACCPQLAHLSPPELLEELELEFAVTEQVHNTRLAGPGGHHGPGGGDVSMQLAETVDFFPNLWELRFLDGSGACDQMQENSEVQLFGFKPFDCDATTCAGGNYSDARWEEVMQRPIYIAFNQMRIALGNPIFGPISYVFSPKVVRPMSFVAPVGKTLP